MANQEFWRVQFRRWFSPRWHVIKWTYTPKEALAAAVKHANGDSRKTINFGKLPSSANSPEILEGQS